MAQQQREQFKGRDARAATAGCPTAHTAQSQIFRAENALKATTGDGASSAAASLKLESG